MNLELYSVLAKVDGMGFPLAYMLLTTATTVSDRIRKKIITQFFDKLHHMGVNLTFVNSEFAFIDPNFYPEIANEINELNQSQTRKTIFTFCPSEHHSHIINL
ncbi:10423_t:CDS:2, partial [Racocetra fulgida]